jgi:hypothetical protein
MQIIQQFKHVTQAFNVVLRMLLVHKSSVPGGSYENKKGV